MWLLTRVLVVIVSWAVLCRADNQPPVPNAGPDQTAYTHDWVTCCGSAVDPEGDPIRYFWEVLAPPPSSGYQVLGQYGPILQLQGHVQDDYLVTLTVWDGMTARLGMDEVTVHFRDNQSPEAVAAISPTHVVVQDTVSFDGSGSHDPEEGPLVLLWDFGDGTMPQFGMVVRHAYAIAGVYSATLQVTDERNSTSTLPIIVEVHSPVSVDDETQPPAVELRANAPNPFNPRTSFGFSLARAGRAVLAIYDVRGARVATLIDADLPAGEHAVAWSGQGSSGTPMPSGVYFAWLQTRLGARTVKVTLAR